MCSTSPKGNNVISEINDLLSFKKKSIFIFAILKHFICINQNPPWRFVKAAPVCTAAANLPYLNRNICSAINEHRGSCAQRAAQTDLEEAEACKGRSESHEV